MKGAFKREYFFFLNERGQLYHIFDVTGFLHPTNPTRLTGPIFLRDTKFLNFFWKHLRHTEPSRNFTSASADAFAPLKLESHASRLFPFVSHCGSEGNYLAMQDSPVVFFDIDVAGGEDGHKESHLSFAGDMREPFVVESLRVSHEGRLYHPVATLPHLNRGTGDIACAGNDKTYGLIGSGVCLTLGLEYFCESVNAEGLFEIQWGGKKHAVPYI